MESLTARLERSPDQYTWDDIRIGDGAVVGVGRLFVDVIRARGDDRLVTRRALAFDHGFAPGHDADYEALLRSTAGELAPLGVTHLAAFTSTGSSTERTLAALADGTEPYDFWAFDIPEPPGLAANGFYVDPVYF